MTAAAYTAAILVLAGCAAYTASVRRGHARGRGRLACLRRTAAICLLTAAICLLTAATLAAIAAVRIARAARHPLRHAGYLRARALRRIPGLPDDGEPLDRDEAAAFIAVCRGWKHAAPERTEHP